MNYLSVENLSKTFGEKTLFENMSFGIAKGQKTALIAKNGAGKSTLLNIICGKILPDQGQVVFRKDIRIQYLPQNPIFDEELCVADEIFGDESNACVRACKQYEQALEAVQKNHSEENQKILEHCMAEMENCGAWDYENKVKEVLSRLGMEDLSQKLGELSGGQRKKLSLSKVLLQESDFLILDEPTNHLDIEMIEWLEDYLARQNLALLLVTHDRRFLDRVCSEIIEIDSYKMYSYSGNYAYFLEKKAEREMQERAELEKAQNTYRRELDWMRRMPSARGTKAKARIEAFKGLENKVKQKKEEKTPELSVKAERMGGKILEIYNLHKAYGDKRMLDDFSYIFKKGEKIGILGKNGIGKSTLLNIIMGITKADAGTVITGQTIKFGYYSQEGLLHQEDKRVIDIIKEVAEVIKLDNGAEISASQFLQYFMFDSTTQYNYFSNLSGGEKRRVFLLKTLMSNPNFLILDEPTNDLDVFTLMLLEDFLSKFKGCLLMVSHDRAFLDNLSDHIFVFEGDGKVKDFYGPYEDYVLYRDRLDKETAEKEKQNKLKNEIERKPSKNIADQKKLSYNERKEYEEIGSKIESLETEKQQLEQDLSKTELDHKQISDIAERIQEILLLLDDYELRWLELDERANF